MRIPFALAALSLAAAAPPQRPAPADRSAPARMLPNGAYLIGSPAARAKLVEYASYTCSHCAHFAAESKPVLKDRMIRSGSTSLELRHLVRDALDLSAVVVARCAGPAGFARVSDAVFAAQDDWLPRGARFDEANRSRLGMYALPDRLRALADGAGLSAIGRANGLTDARLAACFADRDDVERVLTLTQSAPPEVQGTPAFFVNGRHVAIADWSRLEPVLRAQGAK